MNPTEIGSVYGLDDPPPATKALSEEPTAKPIMRRVHLIWGLIGVVAFLATGQYMDRWHDHLRDTEPVQRLLFRSTHIYLLWSTLANVLLGLHLTAVAGWRRVVQSVGSVLLLLAPALFLAAFATEPWLSGLDRPYTRPAVYGSLAGVLLHLVSAWPGARRSD